MPDGPDQETLDRAYAAMAEYHNRALPEGMPRAEPASFAEYQVVPFEEWLIFASPGGFTNQQFLVSDGTVYEFPGWESYDVALEKARALKANGSPPPQSAP